MKNIAIFGFKDSTVGQLINLLPLEIKKKIKFLITTKKISPLIEKKDSKKRPNNKTSFIKNNKIYGLPIYYSKNPLEILKKHKISKIFILEDEGSVRKKVFNLIKEKTKNIKILSYIDRTSKIVGKNDLGEGCIIFPNSYIGYKTDIGNCCFIQPGCHIEHHNVIGNFCDINPGLITGGFTKISDLCEINLAVKIINKISIGKKSRIGAGSLVLSDVPQNSLAFGHPAKILRKIEN